MERLHLLPLPIQQTLNLHQAARVIRDDEIRAGLHRGRAFHLAHRRRDRREFRGECAAKSAATFRFLHLDHFESGYLFQQFARLRFYAEFAHAVAAVVEGRLSREARAKIGDTEAIDEEFGELEATAREFLCGSLARSAVEKLLVENL